MFSCRCKQEQSNVHLCYVLGLMFSGTSGAFLLQSANCVVFEQCKVLFGVLYIGHQQSVSAGAQHGPQYQHSRKANLEHSLAGHLKA